MRQVVGSYDPDDDSQITAKAQKKAREGKTNLQRSALRVCRRTYFKDSKEHKHFKEIETLALGASEDAILHEEWMKHNISLWEKANAKRLIRTMGTLLSAMENEIREQDWTAQNRERVLEQRAQAIKGEGRSQIFT